MITLSGCVTTIVELAVTLLFRTNCIAEKVFAKETLKFGAQRVFSVSGS